MVVSNQHNRRHTDDAQGMTMIGSALEEETRKPSAMALQSKTSDLVSRDDDEDVDDDEVDVGENDCSQPVVIVPIKSHGSSDSTNAKANSISGSSSTDDTSMYNSPGFANNWHTSSSPMAVSLSAKKMRALFVLAVPFLFAVTVRILNTNKLPLPHPEATRTKYIDVNSPPVELPEGQTIADLLETEESRLTSESKTAQQHQQHVSSPIYSNSNPLFRNAPTASISRSTSLKIEEAQQHHQTIPVIVDRGEKIPSGVGTNKKQSAAEALMCRESVINYVINATNGKDECTGLQKAFDETCSQEDDEDEDTSIVVETAHDANNRQDQNIEQRRARGRRRKLLTQQKRAKEMRDYTRLEVILCEASRYLMAVWEFLPFFDKPKFNAEDAVYRLYPRAQRRELRKLFRRHGGRKLEEPEQGSSASDQKAAGVTVFRDGAAGMDEDDDVTDDDDLVADNKATANSNNKNATVAVDEKAETGGHRIKPAKPHNSLHLPTGQAHLSGKTLENTLLLQQEEKVLSDLKKAAANATNATKIATHDPKEDAHASAKAVADTSELVSAVLNDPTAIEARACCTSILNVYHENCNIDAEEEISDKRLFIVVLIMAFCGMVKSLIRHFKIRWLPEAAGCILVGVASGYAASFFPHQDFSFDGNWFLRILVPPIVFEAALSIDKKSFNRHLVPILIYSTVGTVIATVLTATVVYNGTFLLGRYCETIPYIESLIFGSLISSIDPIAVLSVLSNMGMTDTDTLYVLVFGESLLNDGVAIVLFQTLVQFLDASVVIDSETITAAVIHFFVVALGSVLIGVGSGIMCTLYYWAFHGCQTPLVECLMFLCWALLPYYVCDGIGWSGIVSAVTVGFVMDIYVIGVGDSPDDDSEHSHTMDPFFEDERKVMERSRARPVFSGEGHLSAVARIHIGFVTEIVATMMETAIFAYLGLFLFSHRYHWNAWHVIISILACCVSRAIMIPTLSTFANWITSMQKYQNKCRGIHKNSPATGVIVDRRMQMVLWFAGLRGAMSFALVEHIPLYDAVTGEGTRWKAELKAMTSASIMFTVFVLGGSTNYFMDYVGLSPASSKFPRGPLTDMEMVPLSRSKDGMNGSGSQHDGRALDNSAKSRKTRQRVRQKEDPER